MSIEEFFNQTIDLYVAFALMGAGFLIGMMAGGGEFNGK
jgi:hypothetical protein